MKKILFTLLLGMVVFGACSNDDPKEKRELELVYVYEHSYRYEDMKISEPLYITVSYGSDIDGTEFGAYGSKPGYRGYEITEEIYDLLQNTTAIVYINNVKFQAGIDQTTKAWNYVFEEVKGGYFTFSGNTNQVTNTQASDFGKYYFFIRIVEYYLIDKWNNNDFTQEFLGIEAGDRNVKLEFYK